MGRVLLLSICFCSWEFFYPTSYSEDEEDSNNSARMFEMRIGSLRFYLQSRNFLGPVLLVDQKALASPGRWLEMQRLRPIHDHNYNCNKILRWFRFTCTLEFEKHSSVNLTRIYKLFQKTIVRSKWVYLKNLRSSFWIYSAVAKLFHLRKKSKK